MNELMPCPFCGNAKNLAMVNEKHDHSGGYFIACPECGASTIMRYAMGDDPKPLLIEAWNRRAALAAQPGAVGEWKLVPVEPTPAMLVAMWDHRESMRGQSENRIARAGYAAMLAAAPTEAKPAQQDAVDAERYRWLRDRSAWTLISANGITRLAARLPITIEGDQDDAHELDAAIDAAISAKKGGAA